MINKDQYDDIDYTDTLWGHPWLLHVSQCIEQQNMVSMLGLEREDHKDYQNPFGSLPKLGNDHVSMPKQWILGFYRVLPQISRQSQDLPIPLLVLLAPILRCLTVKPRAAWRWRWRWRWPGKSFQLFNLSFWNIMKHDERSWNMDMSWHIRWNSSKFFKYFNHVTTSWSLRISALCLIGFENAAECTSPWLLALRHVEDWLWGRCEPIKNARNWVWRRYSGQSVWCSFCWNCFNSYKNILPKPLQNDPKSLEPLEFWCNSFNFHSFHQGPLDFQPRSPWIFWSLRCLQPPACTKRKGCRMVAFIADHLKPLLAVSCGKPNKPTIERGWYLPYLP